MNRILGVVATALVVACGSSVPEVPSTRHEPRSSPTTPPTIDAGTIDPPAPDVDAAVDAASAPDGASTGVLYPSPDWPTGLPSDVALDVAKLDAAAAIAEANDSYCMLVIRHGRLVYERYWNGTNPTTRNPSWSIAKSYTSALVGIAIDRGDIRGLDQRASDFVPEWQGTDRTQITIRDLVSMTSGLKWDAFEDYVSLATFASDDTTFAIDRPLVDPPGSKWTYDNGSVQVLERVFRVATGHTIEEYAALHLWPRIGSTASWKHDPSGNPTTYANVLASCRDHARLGYLYLHGGSWAGTQVIPSTWVTATLTPSQPMNKAYGFLWWLNGATPALDAMSVAWQGRMVPFAPTDLFAMRGFGNQFVDVIPSLDMLVVRFGKDPMVGFDVVKLAQDSRFTLHDQILAPVLQAVTP